MSGSRFVFPVEFYVDAAGIPYAGGKLFFYQTGTNAPQSTYSDPGYTIPNTNPIILDAAGRAGNVFLLPSPNYRVVLQDANGGSVWDVDPVGPGAGVGGGSAAVPVGGLQIYAGTTAPSGWMWCDGSTISRTVYSSLFAAIGTTYGAGDGATTFSIPDLRGRMIIGRDDMGGTAANRVTFGGSGITGTQLGATGGNELVQTHNHSLVFTDPGHTHTVTQTPHTHNWTITGWDHGGPNPDAIGGGQGASATATHATTGSNANITISTGSSGVTATESNYGSGSSQNMPPALVLNFIIFHG